MIAVKVNGSEFSREEILAWEQAKTKSVTRFLRRLLPGGEGVETPEELAAWKASLPEEQVRAALAGRLALCSWASGVAASLSRGKRKVSVAEIDADFCDAATLYRMFMDTMLSEEPEDLLCCLRANPEHFVLRGVGGKTQEVIEVSGGTPLPEQFFITYGNEEGLVTKREEGYPLQAAGVACLANGTAIGGVRHQMRDEGRGCHVKLMVEFPAALPDANIRAHQIHLACEFYNWLSAFEERLANE